MTKAISNVYPEMEIEKWIIQNVFWVCIDAWTHVCLADTICWYHWDSIMLGLHLRVTGSTLKAWTQAWTPPCGEVFSVCTYCPWCVSRSYLLCCQEELHQLHSVILSAWHLAPNLAVYLTCLCIQQLGWS